MIAVKDEPKKRVSGAEGSGEVLVYAEDQKHTTSFGYEWTAYSRVQTDSTLGKNLSRSRLELNLGFPLEFLDGMTVLELGCGPGRFTEHFAKYAKQVVAVDMSDAIFFNIALGKNNVLALKADLMHVPPLNEPIDLVFCRGVIQHTVSPRDTIHRLFEYAKSDGLVIFDVYKKLPGDWRSFKYFWRPYFKRMLSVQRFDIFLTQHGHRLYTMHHAFLKFVRAIPPLRWVLERTPFLLTTDWDQQYPNLSSAQRLAMFQADLIDALYAEYDQPMTPGEVLATTAAFGQLPYSYDLGRNQFRYKRCMQEAPIRARFTRNGALAYD